MARLTDEQQAAVKKAIALDGDVAHQIAALLDLGKITE